MKAVDHSDLRIPDPYAKSVMLEIVRIFREHGPHGRFVEESRHISLSNEEALDVLAAYSTWASDPANEAEAMPWKSQDFTEEEMIAMWLMEVLMVMSKAVSATGRKMSHLPREGE